MLDLGQPSGTLVAIYAAAALLAVELVLEHLRRRAHECRLVILVALGQTLDDGPAVSLCGRTRHEHAGKLP